MTIDFAPYVTRWSRNCIGEATKVAGTPLDYEPRSAWACDNCHAILIGVKSGFLYEIRKNRATKLKIEPLQTGIRSVFGCQNCKSSGGRVLVGDADGTLLTWTKGKPKDVLVLGRDRLVVSPRLVVDEDKQPWSLVASNRRELWLLNLAHPETYDKITVPHNIRWIVPERKRKDRWSRQEYRWLLISMEGHLYSARINWNATPRINLLNVGRLRQPPVYAISDRSRRDGRIRAIIYGCGSGLRVAMVDRHGVRAERELFGEHLIQYVRKVEIFGVPYVVACGREGRIV